ncbi:FAD-binding oxidoreductase [Aliisedimentitalea scapharcae]|uniref:FAD-binding oxidoreductase n=1 Tax=Aliisedimentitalea scapharcae TaxID=1524259 RepID=A0ABZ2XRZ3_9RHOB
MTQQRKTIAIVGAGIIGVSTAIWLQRDGHDVILIDKAGPGEGASSGNGGILASCSSVPVTGPGLIRKAPKMLFSPDQPLFLRWGYLPKLAPWLMRYLSNANAEDTRRISRAVAGIVGDSLNDHLALSAGTGAEKWIVPSDYAYIYNDRAHFNQDAFGWQLRRENGVVWDELEGDAFRAWDDVFAPELGFAVKMGDHGRIADPAAYVKDLAKHVVAQGGRLVTAAVDDFVQENGQITGVRAGGETIACDAVTVTTGVWSGPLAKKLGLSVPLEAERGYHIELWDPNFMPKTPVMVASGKFVATPMDGRLRLAGVVEFGGIEAGASKAPLNLLKKNGISAFPGLKWKEMTEWMGFRPAPADSIPVIGEIPGIKGAYTGFGHHHIGLTGGPKTGRLLAQMIAGRQPNVDVSVYSPARYV